MAQMEKVSGDSLLYTSLALFLSKKLNVIADGSGSHNTIKERAKYIPIRLSLGERKMLRLVESAMTCCDYTSEVDRPFKSAARRTHAQLKGVTSVLRGLVTACDYAKGQVRSLTLCGLLIPAESQCRFCILGTSRE